jgi:tetratricopeptide (TPR) repeat protein
MAVVVSVFAVGLYSFIGSPDAVTAEAGHAVDNPTSSTRASNEKRSTSVGSVASLVDGLKNRLEREPDDADGWILLARSYEHLGRHEKAAIAYGRAKALGKVDPTLDQTLGSAELPSKDAAATVGPSLRGRISLSREAASLVQPQDTVFIFAKSDAGQAMPLVALRKTIADLPLEYALTDDMAMMPDNSLAHFDKVVVIARVSRSGRAKDVHAGLEVKSEPVSPLAWNYIDLQFSPESAPNSAMGGTSE